ncbi:MAG: FAD/NAD(P)-binding protein [Proteobacteria bacterium]|nr:FAD/NAD(P)-binding protein [Pseudomonadota bacterium]
MKNPYIPEQARIERIVIETDDRNIKSFDLALIDTDKAKSFQFVPGQFAELSLTGKGEAPFGIASSPSEQGTLKFSINKAGLFTTEEDIRPKYKDITVIYGARRPGMLLYRDELEAWARRSDIKLHVTVDAAADGWSGKVGFVPAITKEVAPSADNAAALVCGPPIMIKYTIPVLKELGFSPEQIILSLEMRMKCGIGMCGRCNIGGKYVCKDGPVFTLAQLNQMPDEY